MSRSSNNRKQPLDYGTAAAIRDLCVHQAWHAVNLASGVPSDARCDAEAMNESIERLEHLSTRAIEHAKELASSCAWHAALQRMEEGYLGSGRVPAASPFSSSDAAAEAIEPLKVVHRTLAPSNGDLYELASGAAWYAANERSGLEDESAASLVSMCRAFERLYRLQRRPWRGVNLGGWLLLERGPSAPFYEANGIVGDDGEWDATEALSRDGGSGAVTALAYHRQRHFREGDLAEIARRGFNSVRLPFGYWIVTGPTHGDPYVGPSIELIDAAVEWAARHGLQVLLDLHGNPGGETEEKVCGRAKPDWSWEDWRRDEALEVIALLADRYKEYDHVTGLQVCNEPSRSCPPSELLAHYIEAVATVREAGMPPERVSVVCPCYFLEEDRRDFLKEWREACAAGELDGAVLDMHPYFFTPWSNEVTRGLVSDQAREEAESWDLLPACVVGEFSAAFHTYQGEPCCDRSAEGRQLLNDFLRVQQDAYSQHATHGHFYWTWSDGAVGCGRAPVLRVALGASLEVLYGLLSSRDRRAEWIGRVGVGPGAVERWIGGSQSPASDPALLRPPPRRESDAWQGPAVEALPWG
ncbi:putative cellulase [Emiliania huxleyi CCMP1516]|uniref:glucan 1,3-beta-glucosidase n=3 Tax=Emiliania huxleyi TaxID=2903 RepID=A0A0D3L248_EMIH1|nr:putative cellulase [Emiliania huxleyi CCMP1516]EOD42083.1 putative cellulase [Emiliania huxleyi CCMP1516]|eukprot:XP_005794512.1 putative cellulase [Emiliania huxleyi CCMP1516]